MQIETAPQRPTPGLDPAALTTWWDAVRPAPRHGPLTASLITGGLSNLTYQVTDGQQRWALRRPPLGHALPTAHDMAREYRVLTALHGSRVPVAGPVALCEDPAVLGAPFYLMDFVDGVVLDRSATIDPLTPGAARGACEVLVDTLLELHALDPDAVGLSGFGRSEGFLARQVKRWTAQWHASVTEPRPVMDGLLTRLADVPDQSAPALVHGDYRLSNVLFTPDLLAGGDPRIAAVVDWEMATIGDPLTDVGLLVVYQSLSAAGGFVIQRTPVDRGFLDPGALVARYAAASARDLSALDWYVAFAFVKLAVIAEGIHARHLQGKTVGPGFAGIGAWVPELLDAARQRLDGETG